MGFLHFYRAAILLPFLFHVSSSVYGQTTNATFDVTGHPSANIGVATGDDTLVSESSFKGLNYLTKTRQYTVDITLGGQSELFVHASRHLSQFFAKTLLFYWILARRTCGSTRRDAI